MKKISITEWVTFNTAWSKGAYKGQRFGQAFLNKFYPKVADPELFYEEDTVVAVATCYRKYVDSSFSEASSMLCASPEFMAGIRKRVADRMG